MSQSIAETDCSTDTMPSGTTVGGASSSVNDMVVPHPLPKSMVEMSGGVCPVSHQRLPTSMMQKRTYATQSTLAKASMVSLLSLIHI